MSNVFIDNDFKISFRELNQKNYLKLVKYLAKQKTYEDISSLEVPEEYEGQNIFYIETGCVSDIPQVYKNIEIGVVSGQAKYFSLQFKQEKVEKAIGGLVKLLMTFKEE